MIYSVKFTHQAEEDIVRLDKPIAQHVSNKIDWLSQSIEYITPFPFGDKYKGKYKLRVGDWRVIYSFEHTTQIITVYAVRHRSEVYKI
ncbi:type II toxin-antitoxin system mRNA interferase toxin, RelE/StbE family [Candidatus Kuenenia stuttgartiensis]|uniref:Type II toxin-antitoxin system mRNA interferase toxin, RelE/StbE family n=1 Tax=Kuenenia stuttgartiensis TaxID=174633 RepID=A0A6G7GIQ5_KUEST|nr:type II toxin-antitoxin system RelE/ParE family toxin [Candidatus Kuenenia stuttgartiensis]QII09500.1 type II toxin-antitoxin system mRNA interferase toxin, RelE/StbE family [Candidatus Kuenenia stuttgartiensis]